MMSLRWFGLHGMALKVFLGALLGLFFFACAGTGGEDPLRNGGNADPMCTDPCQSEGERDCANGTSTRQCLLDDQGCLRWSESVPCPPNTFCAEGVCLPTCTSQCVAGSSRCQDQGIQHCVPDDGDGHCLVWGPVEDCPEETTCSGGACLEECSDHCPEDGAKECAGGGVRICGDHNGDGCLDWGSVELCTGDTICSEGACIEDCSNECAQGSTRCTVDGLLTCIPDGDGSSCWVWGAPVPCDDGEVCTGGRCQETCNDECAAGSRRCTGQGYAVCGLDEGGECMVWGPEVACPAGQTCSGGQCVPTCSDECVTGSRRCVPGGYQECGDFDSDPCLEWSETIACPGETICSNGHCAEFCADECLPGAMQCADGGVQSCMVVSPQGCAYWGAQVGSGFVVGASIPCQDGTQCSAGQCLSVCEDECDQGQTRCAAGGAGYQTCGDFDADPCLEWSTTILCEPDFACLHGQCVPQCQDACVQGSRRCADSGAGYQVCGIHDGCLDWGSVTACGAGFVCVDDGSCVQGDVCTQGSHRCVAAGDGYQVCDYYSGEAFLNWGAVIPCEGGYICGEDGTCVEDNQGGNGEVKPEGTMPDYCLLQHPPGLLGVEGLATEGVYGKVYAKDMTDTQQPHPGVKAQVGWGPTHSDPHGNGAWHWRNASYNVQQQNDAEYVGHIIPQNLGTFSYGFRFSVDGGLTWAYCDLDGSDEGTYNSGRFGTLEVVEVWANLQWPVEPETVGPGQAVDYYGQIWVPGVTEQAGQGAGVQARVGYGSEGSDPASPVGDWQWVAAQFHADDGNNDEYKGVLAIETPGTYHVVFRYSLDAGSSWLYTGIGGSQLAWTPATLIVAP